ncbi:hypothetical protein JVT61DRAFT_4026 [Boletus reticuloceps]|uniref:Uncharacterized protein n=1 Tax=Boletus reticuloceps TaxID=495285 RepID=A0A8I3A999_9AGAM|nr:hypothetical protein JVT61DRAFT_4026 [Boletus reticuloceps]
MSLDKNLFTLFVAPIPSYPAGTVVDLTDGSGTVHYRKRRIVSDEQQQQVYRIEVSGTHSEPRTDWIAHDASTDPLSEALLASATAPSATSKHKTLELYNPSKVVELKYTGTLTFRWSFKWEIHEFEWKREECFIIRKPDPPVLVAVTKEPPGRIRTASIQILDYNLNRFDIEDRKGLEIVILMALLTFQDASDTYHEHSTSTTAAPSTSTTTSASAAPPPPPKPDPKKGIARIAELQLGRGQVNEVTVLEEGAIADYAKHCAQLLKDDAMLFISVRSSDLNQVSKVLHVVEETKRLRHKAGDPDLHQYVLYDTNEGVVPHKGPRIINLDDKDGKNKNKDYSPPQSLTVHLSKIDMPELRPRGTPHDRQQTTWHDKDSGKKKDKDKRTKTKDKDKDKQTSPPPRRSTSPPLPHPPTLHTYRSRYFQPTSSALAPSASGPSYGAPPLPPRTHSAQYSAGTLRRQSMYGSLNDRYYSDDYEHEVTPSPGNNVSTSGLLGRFLGR